MNFLIGLESIQHKLSSDYSLNIYFSCRFPYIDGPSFSPYKPLQKKLTTNWLTIVKATTSSFSLWDKS